jgi:hypothetical protein
MPSYYAPRVENEMALCSGDRMGSHQSAPFAARGGCQLRFGLGKFLCQWHAL